MAGRVHRVRADGNRPASCDLFEAAPHERAHAVLPLPDPLRRQVHPLGLLDPPGPQAFEGDAQRGVCGGGLSAPLSTIRA